MDDKITSEYEKWHKEMQNEQFLMAKERRESFSKFELKSKNNNSTNSRKTELNNFEYEDDKIDYNNSDTTAKTSTYDTSEEIIDTELTPQEIWHKEKQEEQMRLAKERRESFSKFQLKSKK